MRFDPEPEVDAALDELLDGGVIAPLTLGGEEERLFRDCELATLAENRIGDQTDPRALDEARRGEWNARVLEEKVPLPSARTYERCYWLLHQGVRAGTIAIARSALGGEIVRVASLYTFPTHRGQGVAGAALEQLRDVLGRRDRGFRLETNWNWQKTVGFYLHLGMWLRDWKRDLVFWWAPDLPRWRINIGEQRAVFCVDSSGAEGSVPLVTAERAGDRLRIDEPQLPRELAGLRSDAWTTLAVVLATHGWPLIRSPDSWEHSRMSDLHYPEGLAYRISIWEAWDRKQGWRVETPRIPGLEYPSWDEFEARWKSPA